MALTKITSDVIETGAITSDKLASGAVSASSLSSITTDNVSEGSTNTYFTNARARSSVSVTGGGLSYDSGTGVIQIGSIPNASLTNSSLTVNSNSVSLGGSVTLDTDDIGEGSTNLYFTNARAQGAISGGTGVTVSSGTISIGQDVSTTATPTFGNITLGTISSGNITTTGYLRGPSSFTIDPATHGDDTGTVVIAGNLQVDGTTTTINSTTLSVSDKQVTLGYDATTDAANNNAGIVVYRPETSNAYLLWNETNERFEMNRNLAISEDLLINASGTQNTTIEIGAGTTSNHYAYIDLIGDSTYTDYGLRLIRNNSGANTTSAIYHRGTGSFNIETQEAASIILKTAGTTALTLDSSQNATFAGNITVGDSHTIGDDVNDNLEIASSTGENILINSANQVYLQTGGSTKLETSASGISVTGTISSGAITADSTGTNTVTIDGTGSYTLRSYHDGGGVGWATGSGTSWNNLLYLDDSNDFVRIYSGQAERARFNSSGIDARSGGFRINGTTVIDSSRNLTNIGTISSGAITSSGTITAGANSGVIKEIGSDLSLVQGAIGLRINDAASALSPTTASLNNDAAVDLGVSNIRFRNLYLSGTISSGAITSTSNITAGNVSLTSTGSIEMQRSGGAFIDFKESNVDFDSRIMGSDAFLFYTGGSGSTAIALTLDSSQNATFSGNVTIGTDSGDAFNSNASLRVQSSSHDYLQIKCGTNSQGGVLIGDVDDDFVGGLIYSNSTNALTLYSNNSAALAFDSSRVANFTSGTSKVATFSSNSTQSTGFNDIVEFLAGSQTGGGVSVNFGIANSTKNVGKVVFNYSGTSGSDSNYLSLGFYDADHRMKIFPTGELRITDGGSLRLWESNDTTGTGSIHLPRGGHITFYGNSNVDHSIGSRNHEGTITDDLRISSYGALYIDLDANANNSSSADFVIGRHGSGTGTLSELFRISGEDALTTVACSTNYRGVHVRGSNAPVISFGKGTFDASQAEWKVGISGNNGANFSISSGAANADKFVITSAGDTQVGEKFYSSNDNHVHWFGNTTTWGTRPAIGRAGGTNFHMTGSAAGDLIIGAEANKYIYFATNTSTGNPINRMRIEPNGIVRIQSAFSNQTVATHRDVWAEDNGELGYNSSVRASKMNIEDVTDASWLYNINPKTFYKRLMDEEGNYLEQNTGIKEYGFIAEDIEEHAPELCFYDIEREVDEDGNVVEGGTITQTDLAGINYSHLTSPMLKLIQQQKQLIDDLTARIEALEG